ncbi:ATP-binding cassette domain-containing protein, partial [Pelomonas sp. KK5]|uniref:ATP-binding cassette domain-containing protein n=1 Tax=Pelomonas sp. KK5 TaxID=1855730 RepID=UPI001E2D7480
MMTISTTLDLFTDAPVRERSPLAPFTPPGGGAPLSLRGLSKQYGERLVLDALNLDVRAGEFLAIIGRSGCGKSTLLRLLAGLEQATAGRLDGAAGEGTRMMFQDARLLPWARVVDNIALGLPKAEGRERALQALAQVGLA